VNELSVCRDRSAARRAEPPSGPLHEATLFFVRHPPGHVLTLARRKRAELHDDEGGGVTNARRLHAVDDSTQRDRSLLAEVDREVDRDPARGRRARQERNGVAADVQGLALFVRDVAPGVGAP
jgi:hypothetical protein